MFHDKENQMRVQSFKKSLRKIAACKADGICARDKLVTHWTALRIESNNMVRLAAVQRLRINWELACPVTCNGEET
jgi:hypothetical protein